MEISPVFGGEKQYGAISTGRNSGLGRLGVDCVNKCIVRILV